MSLSQTQKSHIAARYADALLRVSAKDNTQEAMAHDIAQLVKLAHNSEAFYALCHSPLVSTQDRLKGIQAVADHAGAPEQLKAFLERLAQNHRLHLLPEIHDALSQALRIQRGEADTFITSARALSDKDAQSIESALKQALGKTVNATYRTDESLIGGVTIRVGSRELDASVKGMLARAAEQLYDNIQQT